MRFADNHGVRLAWQMDGLAENPALLLLTSVGTDMTIWDAALPGLLRDFRVLRMDTRGHGQSDAPAGDYSLDMLAGDVLAVMDAAKVKQASVCGISLGGMMAMALALAAPDRINALVLACTSPQMDRDIWQARIDTVRAQGTSTISEAAMQRFFSEGFRSANAGAVNAIKAKFDALNRDGYAGCCVAIRDMELLGRIAAIGCPTLVIAGSKDVATPFAGHGSDIVARIPSTQVMHLPCAHIPCVEVPTEFADALRSFLLQGAGNAEISRARDLLFEAGLNTRRKVLGDAWVDRSLANRTPFNADFQAMISRYAWNEVWTRPGLDHRTRRLLVIAMTVSLGRWEEFRLHVRAGLEQGGFTEDELKETLMQTAVYAGVPAANTAFTEASEILRTRAGKA